MRVVLLAGGTGGALLAEGLDKVLEPGELTVITNPGDDLELYGLTICPDTDAVLYRLGGLFNEETGWGVAGETFAAAAMLERLGEGTWFGLGDQDLGLHLVRASLLAEGKGMAEATAELARRLGIKSRVLPVTDFPLRTFLHTPGGRLTFQEYFVRDHHQPQVLEVELEGVEEADPAPGVVQALAEAERVIIGPSNPAVSIEPILAVAGEHLDPARTIAVTPIVGGRALKGPTVEMLRSLGREPTATGVASGYRPYASRFVLDHQDAGEAPAIHALGYTVAVMDTVMSGPEGRRRLAVEILDL